MKSNASMVKTRKMHKKCQNMNTKKGNISVTCLVWIMNGVVDRMPCVDHEWGGDRLEGRVGVGSYKGLVPVFDMIPISILNVDIVSYQKNQVSYSIVNVWNV